MEPSAWRLSGAFIALLASSYLMGVDSEQLNATTFCRSLISDSSKFIIGIGFADQFIPSTRFFYVVTNDYTYVKLRPHQYKCNNASDCSLNLVNPRVSDFSERTLDESFPDAKDHYGVVGVKGPSPQRSDESNMNHFLLKIYGQANQQFTKAASLPLNYLLYNETQVTLNVTGVPEGARLYNQAEQNKFVFKNKSTLCEGTFHNRESISIDCSKSLGTITEMDQVHFSAGFVANGYLFEVGNAEKSLYYHPIKENKMGKKPLDQFLDCDGKFGPYPPEPEPQPTGKPTDESSSGGLLITLAVIAVLLILIGLVGFVLVRKKSKSKRSKKGGSRSGKRSRSKSKGPSSGAGKSTTSNQDKLKTTSSSGLVSKSKLGSGVAKSKVASAAAKSKVASGTAKSTTGKD